MDGFSVFYMAMVLVAALATATLSHAYMGGYAGNKEELYLLLTLSALGALVLVCAWDFVTFFIPLAV